MSQALGAHSCSTMWPLAEGTRVGRFVILRDLEGRTHAVAAGAVAAVCETDDGALLMLPGGRMVHVPQGLGVVLGWLTPSFTQRI
jgi:hypothetical protein